LDALLQRKALTGQAVRIAKARAATDQISETAAITALRREKAEKLDAGILDKAGKRIRFMSRRQLSVAYASRTS